VEVPQLPLIGGTPDASSNTYLPDPAENDLIGQYGATTIPMTTISQSPGSMPYILQDYQPDAAYGRSLIGRLPETNDFEPAPNQTNPMALGAFVGRNMRSPQPDALRYTLQSNQLDDFNGNRRPMTFGLAVPGADTIEAQMAPKSPESRGITQTQRKGHDETTNLSTTKTLSKKKKTVRGFPNKTQKENTNRVKENGGACARCKKQKNKVRVNSVGLDNYLVPPSVYSTRTIQKVSASLARSLAPH
jgi:hypothetical protein